MSEEALSLLPGLLIGLVLGAAWHWVRERRERRSQDAALLLRAGDAGEWWRPAAELAAGLRDAAAVCGDPRLAELPDPVPVEEVIRAAARSRAALFAEVLPPPPPPPEGIVLVQRSAGPSTAKATRRSH